MKFEEVASVLFVDDSTIRAWLKAFDEGGVEHRLGTVDPDRLDLNANLGRTRGRNLRLDIFKNLRSPGLCNFDRP